MLSSGMSLTTNTASGTSKSLYLMGDEKSYAADHCSSLAHMSYAGKNAASLLPGLFFKVRHQLYSVPDRIYPERYDMIDYFIEKGNRKHYLLIFICTYLLKHIYFALPEGRQSVLIDYEWTLHCFGKQNCSGKHASCK